MQFSNEQKISVPEETKQKFPDTFALRKRYHRLFEDTTMTDVLRKPIDMCTRKLTFKSTSNVRRNPSLGHFAEVTLTSAIPGVGPFTFGANAPTNRDALNLAYVHALLHLQDVGLLRKLLPGGVLAPITAAEVSKSHSAKMGILIHSARYGYFPNFELDIQERAKSVKCRVEIQALGIAGIGMGKDKYMAESMACIHLKRQLEAHHLQESESRNPGPTLYEVNARKTIDFLDYCQHCLRQTITTDVKKGEEWFDKNEYYTYVRMGDTPLCNASMKSKKDSQNAGDLCAFLLLKTQHEHLWQDFLKLLDQNNGQYMKPLRPVDIEIDKRTVLAMQTVSAKLQRERAFEPVQVEVDALWKAGYRDYRRISLSSEALHAKSKRLAEDARNAPAPLQSMRQELPISQYREDILKLVQENDICILVGQTGSGKTTQVPQILLEDAIAKGRGADCNIVCTQPRRIAAKSVAKRVAVERAEALQKTVGYQVRFDNKPPEFHGSMLFCTTGILLKQLQDNGQTALDGLSHILVDEVHERDIPVDYLMIVLRRMLKERKIQGKSLVKVVLMSATMDITLFGKYFGAEFASGMCATITIPGQTFPVQRLFLEDVLKLVRNSSHGGLRDLLNSKETRDYLRLAEETEWPTNPVSSNLQSATPNKATKLFNWGSKLGTKDGSPMAVLDAKDDNSVPLDLVAALVAHVVTSSTDGAILVFLPGYKEIMKLHQILTEHDSLRLGLQDGSKFRIYRLHSEIPHMQQEVFEKLESGIRKIILSTNIAETSVTIPEVTHVIDSGMVREVQYNQSRRLTTLNCSWVSKSNVQQRSGRAGRVQSGMYWSIMPKARFQSLPVAAIPEIIRSDLQNICLDVKALGFKEKAVNFLSEAIEPPSKLAVEAAVQQLTSLGALEEDESLTPLGKVLSNMPVDASFGKMIVLATLFGCFDPVVILASAMTSRDVFVKPLEKRDEAERMRGEFAGFTSSDHLATFNAFNEWRQILLREGSRGASIFARNSFLHEGALRTIYKTARQVEELLQDMAVLPKLSRSQNKHFFGSAEMNCNADSIALIKAILLSGLHPNIAITTSPHTLRTVHEKAVTISATSINTSRPRNVQNISKRDFVPNGTSYVFSNITNISGNVNLRGTTKINPLSVLLFGGQLQTEGRVLSVDSWIRYYMTSKDNTSTILRFKELLDKCLLYNFSRLGSKETAVRLSSLDNRRQQQLLSETLKAVLSSETSPKIEQIDMDENEAPYPRYAAAGM